MNADTTIFIAFNCLCCLLGMVILGLSLMNMKRYPNKIESSCVICCTVTSILLYIINIIVQIPFQLYSHVNISEWTLGLQINSAIEHISWHLAQTFTYLLFIYRIYYAFENTKYKTKSYIYTILIIGAVIFFMECIFLLVTYSLYRYKVISYDLLDTLNTIELISKSLIDLMLSIGMIKLFISKLLQISNEIKTSSDIDDFQHKILLSIATKISILSIIALISTQILILSAAINCIVYIFSDDYYVEVFFYHEINVTYMTVCDSTINIICIYLTLPYNDSKKLYNKLCHGCDSLCLLLTKKYSLVNEGQTRKVTDQYVQMLKQ
eukprot:195260_1